MPIKIDDSILDDMSRMDPSEAQKVFEALGDEDRTQLSTAIDSWKQRKSGAITSPNQSFDLRQVAPRQQVVLENGETGAQFQVDPDRVQDWMSQDPNMRELPAVQPMRGGAINTVEAPKPAKPQSTMDQAMSVDFSKGLPPDPWQQAFFDKANELKDKYVAPYVEKAQAAVAPYIEKGLDWYGYGDSQDSMFGPSLKGTADEALLRSMLSNFGGQATKAATSPEALAAVAKQYGEHADLAMEVAKLAGTAPLYALAPSIIGKGQMAGEAAILSRLSPEFVKAAPTVARLLSLAGGAVGAGAAGAAEAAGYDLLHAATTKGAKLEESVKPTSLAFGAGMGAAGPVAVGAYEAGKGLTKASHKLLSKAGQRVEGVAIAAREGLAQIGNEFEALAREAEPLVAGVPGAAGSNKPVAAAEPKRYGEVPFLAQQGAIDAVKQDVPKTIFERTKLSDSNFKPGFVALAVNEEGKLVGRVWQVPLNGVPKLGAEIPLDGLKAAREIGDLARRHNIQVSASDAAFQRVQGMSEEAFAALYTKPGQKFTDVPGPYKPGQTTELVVQYSQNRAGEVVELKRGGEKGRVLTPAPDLDAGPLDAPKAGVIEASADGLKLRHVRPQPPGSPTVEIPVQYGYNKLGEAVELKQPQSRELRKQLEASGMSPDEAARRTPEPPAPPKPPPPADGEIVYYGPALGTDTAVGRVIGPDPKKKGNLIIEVNTKGVTQSVPAEAVHPALPPGIADIKDLVPPGVPMPDVSFVKPLPHEAADMSNTVAVIQQLQKKSPGLVDRVLDGLLADHLRGPQELQQKISALHGARSLNTPDELIGAVRKGMPSKKLFDAASQDLSEVALGRMKLSELKSKHPEISADMERMTHSMLQEIQDRSRRIGELGGIPEDLTALRDQGLIDQYLATVYRAHYLGKGRWGKIAPTDVLVDGVDFLVREAAKADMFWSPSQVQREVMDIMRSSDPMEAFKGSGLSKPFQHLLTKNKQLPPQLKRLLGEETSGVLRVGLTLANQRAIEEQLKVWAELADSRVVDQLGRSINPYWSPGPRPDLPVQIPNNQRLFGKAAGGYTTKEFADVIQASQAGASALPLMQHIGGWMKTNQVLLNPASWVNNFMRNFKGSVLAGGLDPFRPLESGKSFIEAAQYIRAWGKNPTEAGPGRLVLEARRVGALPSGFGRVEIAKDAEGLAYEIAKELGTLPPNTDLFSALDMLRTKAIRLAKGNKNKLAAAYDAIDTFFKMGNYVSLKKKFLAQGMENEAAARLAAQRINSSFPNFEHVGRWVDNARKAPYGAIAPYLSGFAEDQRVNAMLLQRLAQGEEGLKGRLLASAMLMGGAAYGVKELRRMNGISDEEVDAALASRSKSSQTYRPHLTALPTRDAKGRVQFVDTSAWVPELQLLQGHPDDPALSRIASNLLLGPIDSSLYEQPARDLLARVGVARQLPDFQRPMYEGQQGTLGALAPYFQNSGVVPGAVSKFQKDLGRLNPTSPSQEALTPGQFAARQVGLPVVGGITTPKPGQVSPARVASAKEFAFQVSELRKQIAMVAKDPRLPPEEKSRLIKEISARIAELGRQQQEINSKIKAAEGVPQ